MNTRNFLKSLIISAAALPLTLRAKTDDTKFILKDIPIPPIGKYIEFEHNKLYFTIMSTTNILIESKSDVGEQIFELNMYNEYCKVIGTVRNQKDLNLNGKRVRLEGDLLLVKNLNDCWKEQVEKLVEIGVKSLK